VLGDDGAGQRAQVRPWRRLAQRLLEISSHLLDRPPVAAAETEQAGGHRLLQRLGGAEVGQAGSDRARRQPVLHQGHRYGVEYRGLLGRGEAPHQLQEGQLPERHVADQLHQVVPADHDPVSGAVGDVGAEAALAAQFPVTVSLVL
jgi:hypothetical protein